MFFSKLSVAVAAIAGCAQVSAFFRMQCYSRLVLDQVDPIVEYGSVPSKHIHTIMGGSNFSPTCKGRDLRNPKCTSCRVKGDGSAYWVPALYFKHKDTGMMELVHQKNDMLVYYLPERGLGEGNTKKIEMFPPDFVMVAGDAGLRNYTIGNQPTEASRRQRAVGFNCLNYKAKPEGFLERRAMPTKEEMKQCVDGLRGDIAFPACWNGKDADSHDHRSHVAYPYDVQGGACPDGYDHRLPSILYETLWDVAPYSDKDGEFIWSNGDPTGYGYHGDFMFGWNDGLFEKVMADPTCTHLSITGGVIEDCKTLAPLLQTNDEMAKCTIEPFSKHKLDGGFKELPGPNPISYGPAPAPEDHGHSGNGGSGNGGSGHSNSGSGGSGRGNSGDGNGNSAVPEGNPDQGVQYLNVPAPPSPPASEQNPAPYEAPVAPPPASEQNPAPYEAPVAPPPPPPPATSCTAKDVVVTVTAYETATVWVDSTPEAKPAYGKARRHMHGKRHHGRRF